MRIILIISLLCTVYACEKPSQRACWKTSGPIVQKPIELQSFLFLKVGPYIEIEFVQDSLNFLEWEAGANLTSFLNLTYDHDTLILNNENRCKFLRYSNGHVKAKLHFSAIKELHLYNSEQILTNGKWTTDELLVHLKEGVGKIELNLEVGKLDIRNNYGWQPTQIKGICQALFVDIDGSASLNCAELKISDSVSFRSSSPLSSYVMADSALLKAQLYGPGNLYYLGVPSQILKSEYNTGKVLPK